ncbi:hypothetical protein Tco_0015353 [Tanacetum coccineum]
MGRTNLSGLEIISVCDDAFDSALDLDDMEGEIDEVVDKVLTVIFGDTATQIPEAVRKKPFKDEGLDDDEDLEEIRARLAKVRS